MSKRLFGQIVLLILFANAVYFGGLQILNWQAARAYAQRSAAMEKQAAAQAEAYRKAAAAALQVDETSVAAPRDENENMINGEVVHRVGDNWVNSEGAVVQATK